MERVKYTISILTFIILISLTGCRSKSTPKLTSYSTTDPVIGVVLTATGDTVYSIEDYEKSKRALIQANSDVNKSEYATVQDSSGYNSAEDISNTPIQQDPYSNVPSSLDSPSIDPMEPQTESSLPYSTSIDEDVAFNESSEQAISLSTNDAIEDSSTIKSIDDVPIQDSSNGVKHRGNVDNFYTYDIPEQQNTTEQYVCNTNTMKFHIPTCEWVKRIKPEHYLPLSDRAEIIALNYIPCKVCNP